MSEQIKVCAVDELEPGTRRSVTVHGRDVVVFNADGEFHALQNTCPHLNGPVCQGKIDRELVAEHVTSGKRRVDRLGDRKIITCPWHGWEYYLDTGEHVGVDDVQVPTFDVEVEDGTVYLSI